MCRRWPTRASSCATRARSFLGGPPLVKAATGEVVSAEELGGADVHTPQSGVVDHSRARRRARARHRAPASSATSNARQSGWRSSAPAPRARLRRRRRLYGIVPADLRKPYDVREVIARIVDGSEFDEFKALYGTDAGHAASRTSGAIRSASSPTTASCSPRARSRARISSSCACQRGIPLVFLQNITGFMVGRQVRGGRHRQGRRQDGDRGGDCARCRSSRSSSAAASAPATTACAGAPTRRASCGCGRTRASPSWAASRRRACWRTVRRDGMEARGEDAGRPRRKRRSSRRSARSTRRRAIPTTPPPGCGTTASSIRPRRARCWRSASPRR